jgi:mitochondrial chaperone BCS1
MNFTATHFSVDELSRDVSDMVSITIEEKLPLYKYMLHYIANNLVDKGKSLSTDVLATAPTEVEEHKSLTYGRVEFHLGIGEYAFRTYNGEVMYALHHILGKPVGTDCGIKMFYHLVVFAESSYENIGKFLHEVLSKMEESDEGKFTCYSWHVRYQDWEMESKVNKRPIDSVVLPQDTKLRLINDISKFLDANSKLFYLKHGIPYRRSYLFYGIPGTGKTSMVQALAAHFHRNVCFLMPTHPEMTDDSLRAAINRLPDNSIVVFEDIDSLFTKDRANKVKSSSLTFSGLLNALDGIGSSTGQIIILTTNLREHLDAALLRNGRVDLHVEFTYATKEQLEVFWKNFYPESVELSNSFATLVTELLAKHELHVTTATLQHYFVSQMDKTAEEALLNIDMIIEEIKLNNSQAMLKDLQAKKQSKKKSKRRSNDSEEEEENSEDEEQEEEEESDEEEEKENGKAKKNKRNNKKKNGKKPQNSNDAGNKSATSSSATAAASDAVSHTPAKEAGTSENQPDGNGQNKNKKKNKNNRNANQNSEATPEAKDGKVEPATDSNGNSNNKTEPGKKKQERAKKERNNGKNQSNNSTKEAAIAGTSSVENSTVDADGNATNNTEALPKRNKPTYRNSDGARKEKKKESENQQAAENTGLVQDGSTNVPSTVSAVETTVAEPSAV